MLLIIWASILLVMVVVTLVKGTNWFWGLKVPVRVGLMTGMVAFLGLAVWRQVKKDELTEPVFVDNARIWSVLPLRVLFASELSVYDGTVRGAMSLWNHEVGCPLFVETVGRSAGEYDVRFVFTKDAACDSQDAQQDPAVSAGTWYCPNGTADIDVQRLDDVVVAYQIIAHELGHVLGLAHDRSGLMDASVSLMNPVLPNPKDVAALRARYCR